MTNPSLSSMVEPPSLSSLSSFNFLRNAIDAKGSKIDKKLKMVELQLKKLKLDKEGNKDGAPMEESDGFVISDRNELMKKLLKKD